MFQNITKHTLTLRYAIALGIIGVFAGFGYIVQAYSLTDYQVRQQIVNELAKERVSVQHIAFLLQRLDSVPNTQENAEAVIKELDNSLERLDRSLSDFDVRLDDLANDQYQYWRSESALEFERVVAIRSKLESFRNHAKEIVRIYRTNPQLDQIDRLIDRSLNEISLSLDSVFSTSIEETQNRLGAFRRIELAIFLVIILCLFASVIFIFRPMVNAVIHSQSNLRVTRDDIEKKAKELEEAKAKAEEASAAKSDFLANISHEIRTPMGSILGYAERLMSPTLSSVERLRYASIIRRNGKILLDLIDDLLDISKIEAGQLEVERMKISLRQIMGEVHSLLGWRAREKGLGFNVRCESAPSHIVTDPMRLRQILTNIIGNAIKFTGKGHIDVTIRTRPAVNGQRPKMEFVVNDTGCGIDVGQVEKLFEPFVQADNTTTRKYGGTGLGLALSRRLARALGGDLYLEQTQLGLGSSFVAFIDPGEMDKQDLNCELEWDEFQQIRSESHSLFPERGLQGFRILIVEDGEENRDLFRYYLETAGAYVCEAVDGVDGVEKALAHEFDLVLMDIQMPRLDGFEALATLRLRGYTVPVVALTAHAMKGERERCRQAGFLDHIGKPVTAKGLVETLRALVSERDAVVEDEEGSREDETSRGNDDLFAMNLDFGGEIPETIKKTIDRFVANIPERIDEIKQAYEANDVERLGRLFHKIKGSAGACGFMRLMERMNAFEDEVRQTPDLGGVSRRHYRELDRVVSESRGWHLN